MIAVVDDAAVHGLDIGEHVVFQQHARHHREGQRELLALSGNLRRAGLLHRILEADDRMAVLTGQFLLRNLLPVERVGDFDRNGQRFRAFALIINVLALCGPESVLKGLLALDILHTDKPCHIRNFGRAFRVGQPVADKNPAGRAVGRSEHIHGFILHGVFRQRKRRRAAQQRQ